MEKEKSPAKKKRRVSLYERIEKKYGPDMGTMNLEELAEKLNAWGYESFAEFLGLNKLNVKKASSQHSGNQPA